MPSQLLPIRQWFHGHALGHIHTYIYTERDGAAKLFLKIKRKEAQVNFITKDKSSEIHIGEPIIKSSDGEKLLGIKIDSKLHF